MLRLAAHQNRQFIHTFSPRRATTRGRYRVEGVSAMTDVMDLPAKVVSFRDEARECFRLAKGEPHGELRIILMGMAVGWLKFANHATPSEAPQLEHADG